MIVSAHIFHFQTYSTQTKTVYMNKLLNLKTVLIVAILFVYSKQQYAQSQFLKLGENASTLSLSHDFSVAGLSTLKYTKSFSGKLDTYLSLGYASINQGDFASPGRIHYYLPSIGLDYFLFKKETSPFSASVGLEYTRVTANIGVSSFCGLLSAV